MANKKTKHKKEFDVTADKAVGLLKQIFNAVIIRRVTVKDKKSKAVVRIPLIFLIILFLIPPISWVIIIAFLILLIVGYKFTFETK